MRASTPAPWGCAMLVATQEMSPQAAKSWPGLASGARGARWGRSRATHSCSARHVVSIRREVLRRGGRSGVCGMQCHGPRGLVVVGSMQCHGPRGFGGGGRCCSKRAGMLLPADAQAAHAPRRCWRKDPSKHSGAKACPGARTLICCAPCCKPAPCWHMRLPPSPRAATPSLPEVRHQ